MLCCYLAFDACGEHRSGKTKMGQPLVETPPVRSTFFWADLAKFRQRLREVGPRGPNSVRIWPGFDRHWNRPNWADFGPKLARVVANFGALVCSRCQSNLVQIWRTWPSSIEFGPISVEFAPGSTKFGPIQTKSGPRSTKRVPISTIPVKQWPRFAEICQTWTEFGQIWPDLVAKFGQALANVDQPWSFLPYFVLGDRPETITQRTLPRGLGSYLGVSSGR